MNKWGSRPYIVGGRRRLVDEETCPLNQTDLRDAESTSLLSIAPSRERPDDINGVARACLEDMVERYFDAVIANDPSMVPLSDQEEASTKDVPLQVQSSPSAQLTTGDFRSSPPRLPQLAIFDIQSPLPGLPQLRHNASPEAPSPADRAQGEHRAPPQAAHVRSVPSMASYVCLTPLLAIARHIRADLTHLRRLWRPV